MSLRRRRFARRIDDQGEGDAKNGWGPGAAGGRPAHAVAGGAVAAVIVACAATLELPELTRWSPPTDQPCDVLAPVGDLHGIVDSAALADGIAALDLPDGALLLSVDVDSGEVERFRRIETTLPPSAADRLESLVEARVASVPGGTARGRLIARVGGGAVSELGLGPYQQCFPRLRNERTVSISLEQVYRRTGAEGTATIWMFVDTAGQVVNVQIRRSLGLAIDTAFARVARSARFHPALLDRQPTPVWVSIDFTLEGPKPSGMQEDTGPPW